MDPRLRPGATLPVLEQRLELVDLVMYAGATWDWHRWHYDAAAAAEANLRAPLVDGQMLGAFLARQALGWAGPRARIRRMSFRFAAMVFAGDTIRCEGEVRSVGSIGGALVVSLAQRILVGERAAIESATMELEVPE